MGGRRNLLPVRSLLKIITARAGPGASQEPGNPSGYPIYLAGAQASSVGSQDALAEVGSAV